VEGSGAPIGRSIIGRGCLRTLAVRAGQGRKVSPTMQVGRTNCTRLASSACVTTRAILRAVGCLEAPRLESVDCAELDDAKHLSCGPTGSMFAITADREDSRRVHVVNPPVPATVENNSLTVQVGDRRLMSLVASPNIHSQHACSCTCFPDILSNEKVGVRPDREAVECKTTHAVRRRNTQAVGRRRPIPC
jgi:hypothetical protein